MDNPENVQKPSTKTLLRYTREEVLSFKEAGATVNFTVPAIFHRNKRPRNTHPSGTQEGRKSQSEDTDATKHHGSSHEDLSVEEPDQPANSWHRVSRHQWHNNSTNQQYQTGYFPYSRQRYPSGSHGDDQSVSAHVPLRPAPDVRRGGHGDWSRGCAGWRQRSYSGSERTGFVLGSQTSYPGFRGRGGYSGLESEDRGGKGRGRGRHPLQQQNRGANARPQGSAGSHRPASCVDSVDSSSSRNEDHEEFWREEDWVSADSDESPAAVTHPSKSRERLNSGSAVNSSQSNREVRSVTQGVGSVRIHSKSCSVDPPPGFDSPETSQTASSTVCTEVKHLSNAPASTESGSFGQTIDSSSSSTRWYYIDSMGQTRGPFANQQMSNWLAGGFLPLGIEIRRDCDECFLTLADHMNLAGRVPFWNGYTQAPITRMNVQSLAAATDISIRKPRWVGHAPPPCLPPTTYPPPAMSVPRVAPPTQPSDTVSNVAAAAAATAVLFATATATLANKQVMQMPPALPIQIQQQNLPPKRETFVGQEISQTENEMRIPIAKTCESGSANQPASAASVPTTPTLASNLLSGGQEILRLYTEAQALAAHAAKVEAERQELADKLAAINSTAAKLLASTPIFPIPVQTSTQRAAETVLTTKENTAPVEPQTGSQSTPTSGITNEKVVVTPVSDVKPESSVSFTRESSNSASSSDNQQTVEVPVDQIKSSVQRVMGSPESEAEKTTPAMTAESTDMPKHNLSQSDSGDAGTKKSKRKNKKAKKGKLTVEQERTMAWEAEFERRKAAALERKLAEEAEARRLIEEDAAAKLEEQAAAAREQARLANEQRKREALRAKAESQMENLHLPQSVRWAKAGTGNATGLESHPGAASLLSIQAAQATEEAEKKRKEALMAEQMAVQAIAQAATAASAVKHASAWSAVAHAENKTGKPVNKPPAQSAPPKAEFPTLKTSAQSDHPKSAQVSPNAPNGGSLPGNKNVSHPHQSDNTTVTTTTMATANNKTTRRSSGGVAPVNATNTTSIWDLPTNGRADTVNTKNAKKQNKKKNTNVSREAASFAAKEELAHWCESQLSSMPLSGVDLPTLVDLLCEMEAADQVVECLESSLGRSKRVSKFSKAFLEKRACILNTVP
ncbi:unnamed protein product [Calicophoron daubneyi]|uniref:GYF domain-containing protein n=1 Tax=Calicophoron daubneyi TaxID=300641 RepID=A0AAV2TL99_CALDB